MVKKVVLVRHGQSIYNLENKFTGWADVDLSEEGVEEAKEAGAILRKHGYYFDVAYTSVLKRAIRTLWVILHEMDLLWLPVYHSWRLNERHYGALQGLNKTKTAQEYGEEKVHAWRRSINERPPELNKNDPRYEASDPKYKDLKVGEFPLTENLADTERRVITYWRDTIIPAVKSGKSVLIASHGNTIRALMQYLDNIPSDEMMDLNVPTGVPLVYELDDHLAPIRHYYLESEGEK